MKKFLALSLSDVVFVMLIKVKMPTIVGILTFISMIVSCSAELSMEHFQKPRGLMAATGGDLVVSPLFVVAS